MDQPESVPQPCPTGRRGQGVFCTNFATVLANAFRQNLHQAPVDQLLLQVTDQPMHSEHVESVQRAEKWAGTTQSSG